ncbi:MAG: aldose epimerase [Actinobacteria bacterium]|nr:MAG: aldose epimerase [Actinomycetota bacterium]
MNRSITLSSGPIALTIDPDAGARLSSLFIHDHQLLVQRADDDSLSWGCYPMVPWAGRTRDATFTHDAKRHQLQSNHPPHAIHGLVHDIPWTIVEATHTRATLLVELDYRWPFRGWVEQVITVSPDCLELQLRVQTSAASMPVQIGWHPWFVRPAQLQVAFGSMYARDEFGIATTRHAPTPPPWDDCFTDTQSMPIIRFDNGITLLLESDCSHWVIYDEPSHALCVEPQSGPPNGLNSEPLVITPGGELARFFRLTMTGYQKVE